MHSSEYDYYALWCGGSKDLPGINFREHIAHSNKTTSFDINAFNTDIKITQLM